ncbi:sigma-70 family RNA polymerase sigma factor [Isoptericola sp. NEAU-Y5]|uniref:Sigma-70 family RNA polymerase sigma factor n=1 Tax=Isoptericola luteus TaxID=2879484 RepID=A0ABS7ZI36_9MICO|nr:sigma-70 family RNA polymerase sigma factor [Isoptericola sp. NEAU-Y5]MCA5891750.1 sigma-70 family RNA polymerase sigma factor [Isoptericola sp. NEAU-Y5]MCA5894583.1 sigma-70 family RNA polymerase sigma factor [Isoptericola sp. NEAU-Y5]
MSSQTDLAENFEAERGRLLAIATRVLGSASSAEDVVQEAWVRLARQDPATIENLAAWLTTVVGRLSIDVLRSRAAKGETSFEAQFRDPVVTADVVSTDGDPESHAIDSEALGLALLTVLGSLRPDERLAFVLHDVFGVPFAEIGVIIDKSVDAAKMAASRARRKVRDAARPTGSHRRQRLVVDAFLAAARDGDFEALLEVLHPDLVWEVRSPRGVTVRRGRAELVRAVVRGSELGFTARQVVVDGRPGVLAFAPTGRPVGLMTCTVEHRRMTAITAVADRATLGRMELPDLA